MTTPKLASSPPPGAPASVPAAQGLWLELLQQVAARAAHELKGALNGVALNLEVVRSRSGQPEAPVSRVASFADSAAGQLEAVIAMSEALLVLTRPPSMPASVVRELGALGALLAPAAAVAGNPLTMHLPADGSGEAAVGGIELRAVLAASLLAALGTGSRVTVRLGEKLDLSLSCEGTAPALDPRAASLAAAAGIQIRTEGDTLILTFPPPRKGPMPELA